MNIESGEGALNCANLAVALVLAADGELSNTEWLMVEQHLAQCAECRTHWATFAQADRRLRECAADLNAADPSDLAARIRLVNALSDRRQHQWPTWLWPSKRWGWTAVAFASLSLVIVAAWTIMAPWNRETRRSAATTGLASGNAEVIRVQLLLAPVGDPFLDASPSESLVLADVAVGEDGQPRALRLAE